MGSVSPSPPSSLSVLIPPRDELSPYAHSRYMTLDGNAVDSAPFTVQPTDRSCPDLEKSIEHRPHLFREEVESKGGDGGGVKMAVGLRRESNGVSVEEDANCRPPAVVSTGAASPSDVVTVASKGRVYNAPPSSTNYIGSSSQLSEKNASISWSGSSWAHALSPSTCTNSPAQEPSAVAASLPRPAISLPPLIGPSYYRSQLPLVHGRSHSGDKPSGSAQSPSPPLSSLIEGTAERAVLCATGLDCALNRVPTGGPGMLNVGFPANEAALSVVMRSQEERVDVRRGKPKIPAVIANGSEKAKEKSCSGEKGDELTEGVNAASEGSLAVIRPASGSFWQVRDITRHVQFYVTIE